MSSYIKEWPDAVLKLARNVTEQRRDRYLPGDFKAELEETELQKIDEELKIRRAQLNTASREESPNL